MFAALALGVMVAGTLYSFYAQRQAADVAEKQARYNAKYNEQVQKQAAEEAMRERTAQEREDRRTAMRERARTEAMYAKYGLAMTGSPLYALEEQAKAQEVEIANQTRRSEVGFIKAFEQAENQRKITIAEGRAGAQAMKTGATAGLISGLGSAAMSGIMFYGSAGGANTGSGGASGSYQGDVPATSYSANIA